MNRQEADAAAEALHVVVLRLDSKRAGWLVIADHDQVLSKLIEIGDTVAAVVTAAEALAAEAFGGDAGLMAPLGGLFDRVGSATREAAEQFREARDALRRELAKHQDEGPRRRSQRSPWQPSPSGNSVLGPLTDATATVWALVRPRDAGNASDLSEHWWLYAGLARLMAELWSICRAEEARISTAYCGVETVRSPERVQQAVSNAARQWHRAGMVFIAMLELLRRRARQGGAAPVGARVAVTSGAER